MTILKYKLTDMPEETTQPAEKVVQTTGTTNFGFGQIGKATPQWATWAFRVFFYLTSTVSLALTLFTTIPPDVKLQIMEGITFANLAVHGLSKMFGITETPTDYYSKT